MATATAKAAGKDSTTERDGIKGEIVNAAELIKRNLQIDTNSGAGTLGKDIYAQLLPEDLDVKTVERVREADATIAAAVTLAVGEAAIPVMKKNKDLDRVTVSLPATGRDSFDVVFDRSRTVQTAPGSGEKVEKFGHVSTAFNTYGTRNRGQLSAVKQALQTQAAKALGGK